jgi:hypothetical protein
MYELWLVANIIWETLRAEAAWTLGIAALLVVLWTLALARARGGLGQRWRLAAVIGVLVAGVGVLGLPSLTRSSLSDVAYWVDWLNLIGLAAAFGALAFALSWPLLAVLGGRRTAG